MDNTKYYIAFSHALGIGPITFKKLVEHFGDVKSAYLAKETELKHVLTGKTLTDFFNFRKSFLADSIYERLYKKNIQVVTLGTKEYPKQLAQLSDPPICLYVRGNKKLLQTNPDVLFAIVGSRKTTSYGRDMADKFAGELVRAGFSIVSGMATGIDSMAHWGTVKAKGQTIAILGCGVDIVYPPANEKLYKTIINGGGAVVSEFPPGMTVLPGLFVARNRLISGLSRGVLVVEGAKNSGALITAGFASEQGKEVFALPSSITSPLSSAPNWLIKNGAKLVTSLDDILTEFNLNIHPAKKTEILAKYSGFTHEILKALGEDAYSPDELSHAFACPIDQILTPLSLLELDGVVAKNDEGRFYLKNS